MSFTQDELQAFNTILEQRLLAHRRELERTFDQRVQTLRREFEQRLTLLQQHLSQVLTEQQRMLKSRPAPHLSVQPSHVSQMVSERVEDQPDRLLESAIGQAFAAQLPALEQLIRQSLSMQAPSVNAITMYADEQQSMNAVELQTEIPWDDLVEAIDQALNDRLAPLCTSILSAVKGLECCLSTQLLNLRTELTKKRLPAFEENVTNIQDVVESIGQLEHVIESMHVVMTTNHGLLSNRLYQHQHLPLDRAHPPSSHQMSDSPPLAKFHEGE